MRSSRHIGLRAGIPLLAAALAVVVVGCGGSAQQSGTGNAGASVDTLTVAIPDALPNFGATFWAQSQRLFAKNGLKVKILENTAANTLNLVASGQADLTMFTSPNALLLAGQGKATSIIMAGQRDSGAALVSASHITTLAQLKALSSGCHIAVLPAGSQGYGYGQVYTHLPQLGLQQCQLEQTTSTAVQLARLQSDQIQAVVGALSLAHAAAQGFGAHILINPNVPNYRQTYGLPEFLSAGYFGLTSDLQQKRQAIIRFIRAIMEVNPHIVPANADQLTHQLQQYAGFSAVKYATLLAGVQQIVPYLGPGTSFAMSSGASSEDKAASTEPGYIPKNVWETSLQQYKLWGLPHFDSAASVNSYGARVDMSYFTAAINAQQAAGATGQ